MDDELARGELLLSDKKSNWLISVVTAILIIFLGAFTLFTYFCGCAVVEGHSMENTLHDGQRALLLKHGYNLGYGDIITLKHPNDDDEMLIKRVIGMGDDKILFVYSKNGNEVDLYRAKAGESHFSLVYEPYIKERMNHRNFGSNTVVPFADRETIEAANFDTAAGQLYLSSAITVPKNEIYFLGDNRNNSSDSRAYGTSKTSDVTGKVIGIAQHGSTLEGFLNFMFSL